MELRQYTKCCYVINKISVSGYRRRQVARGLGLRLPCSLHPRTLLAIGDIASPADLQSFTMVQEY